MDLTLTRTDYRPDGVFSELKDNSGKHICFTLERSFPQGTSYLPKVPSGVFKCVRGTHQLDHGDPIEAFEVTGVPGHTGILFHIGNYNHDSDGCILLGLEILKPADWMLTMSAITFKKFMDLQENVTEFTLTVEGK